MEKIVSHRIRRRGSGQANRRKAISYPPATEFLPAQVQKLRAAIAAKRAGPKPSEEGTEEEGEPLIGGE
jgi:hypothetical protein